MGVLSTNNAQITSGGLISASFVSDVYNVLTGATADTVVISGSTVNHGLSVSGDLTGTASIATSAETSSYVSGSSVDGSVALATTSTSASFATTAVSASFVANTLTFQTGTLSTVVNGALAVSSSGELYFGSASSWHKVTLG